MCGIAGIINNDLNNSQLLNISKKLLLGLNDRGQEACGIYTLGLVRKAPISAKGFVNLIDNVIFGDITLLHTRAGTGGPAEINDNNHPVTGINKVIIHNGMIHSLPRIKGYNYKGTVDTEILLSHIETYGEKPTLKLMKDDSAIAFCDWGGDELTLWRRGYPIELGFIPGKRNKPRAIIFASSEYAIRESLEDIANKVMGYTKCYIKSLEECSLMKICKKTTGRSPLGKIEVSQEDVGRKISWVYQPYNPMWLLKNNESEWENTGDTWEEAAETVYPPCDPTQSFSIKDRNGKVLMIHGKEKMQKDATGETDKMAYDKKGSPALIPDTFGNSRYNRSWHSGRSWLRHPR